MTIFWLATGSSNFPTVQTPYWEYLLIIHNTSNFEENVLQQHKFGKQIASVVCSCFYQNQLPLVFPSHAWVTPNSFQNKASQLLAHTLRQENITAVLLSLHWLPVHLKINGKLLLFGFKALNALSPFYLAELLLQIAHAVSMKNFYTGIGLLLH